MVLQQIVVIQPSNLPEPFFGIQSYTQQYTYSNGTEDFSIDFSQEMAGNAVNPKILISFASLFSDDEVFY